MTRNIVIKNPSQKMIQVFDAMREKKQQQLKMLAEKEHATVTIVVWMDLTFEIKNSQGDQIMVALSSYDKKNGRAVITESCHTATRILWCIFGARIRQRICGLQNIVFNSRNFGKLYVRQSKLYIMLLLRSILWREKKPHRYATTRVSQQVIFKNVWSFRQNE